MRLLHPALVNLSKWVPKRAELLLLLQLLNLTWGAGASVAAGIVLEKIKTESKPIQVRLST